MLRYSPDAHILKSSLEYERYKNHPTTHCSHNAPHPHGIPEKKDWLPMSYPQPKTGKVTLSIVLHLSHPPAADSALWNYTCVVVADYLNIYCNIIGLFTCQILPARPTYQTYRPDLTARPDSRPYLTCQTFFKTFIGDLYWRPLLETFIGDLHWRPSLETFNLETFIGDLYWRPLFETFIQDPYWRPFFETLRELRLERLSLHPPAANSTL
jgi:hypothetical protein